MASGTAHPLLLAASGVIACGTAVRAIAGELEAGTLELVLSRPVERARHLAAYVVFTFSALAGIAVLYGAGAYAAWLIVEPEPGSLSAASLARASVLLALLLWAIAGYSLLCSAFATERGRALGVAVGVTIGLYAWNFLASLVGTLAPFARISPWYWFNPSPVLGGGPFPYGYALVLAAVAVVRRSLATWQFPRRDLFFLDSTGGSRTEGSLASAATPTESYVGRWSRGVAVEFIDWPDAAPGRSWLDLGCGTGALTTAILERADPAAVVGDRPVGQARSRRRTCSYALLGTPRS